ncbi:hypothetical protein DGMP_26830 [Desulfomarina profundi]|uniref:PAS domain-containing protein n=1 Tax=Desulfomarina profundi TaxID=2772557 RepID=A0A8D5FJI9_9BACT|nr:PAS domain-containing protein [Desulfomarina profundi]BCL61990.1 hypothetical protein DGMP_26830 [Desulfomarina profundi]
MSRHSSNSEIQNNLNLPDQFLQNGSNELGHFIFYNLPIGIFRSIPDENGHFILANPPLVKMYGYSRVENFLKIPVNKTYWDPNDRKLLIAELLSHNEVNRKVIKFKKKNGDFFWGQ